MLQLASSLIHEAADGFFLSGMAERAVPTVEMTVSINVLASLGRL
jgi:hypothetical protein